MKGDRYDVCNWASALRIRAEAQLRTFGYSLLFTIAYLSIVGQTVDVLHCLNLIAGLLAPGAYLD
jgi:hypothetical protein